MIVCDAVFGMSVGDAVFGMSVGDAVFGMSVGDSISLSVGHGDASGFCLVISVW
jgi:hypothetical protein